MAWSIKKIIAMKNRSFQMDGLLNKAFLVRSPHFTELYQLTAGLIP